MLQENVDLYAKWIDKLGSGEVTEEGYEDTFEGFCVANTFRKDCLRELKKTKVA